MESHLGVKQVTEKWRGTEEPDRPLSQRSTGKTVFEMVDVESVRPPSLPSPFPSHSLIHNAHRTTRQSSSPFSPASKRNKRRRRRKSNRGASSCQLRGLVERERSLRILMGRLWGRNWRRVGLGAGRGYINLRGNDRLSFRSHFAGVPRTRVVQETRGEK